MEEATEEEDDDVATPFVPLEDVVVLSKERPPSPFIGLGMENVMAPSGNWSTSAYSMPSAICNTPVGNSNSTNPRWLVAEPGTKEPDGRFAVAEDVEADVMAVDDDILALLSPMLLGFDCRAATAVGARFESESDAGTSSLLGRSLL